MYNKTENELNIYSLPRNKRSIHFHTLEDLRGTKSVHLLQKVIVGDHDLRFKHPIEVMFECSTM
jgi:hypothetical protein